MPPLKPLGSDYLIPVLRRYTQFWQKLISFTDGRAQEFPDKEMVVSLNRDSGGCICVETPQQTAALLIRGLPKKPDSIREDLDVFIQFRQLVQAESNDGDDCEFIAINSNIRLMYLETQPIGIRQQRIRNGNQPNKDKVYCGLHFDLSGEDQYDHPLYHAQFDTSCIVPRAVDNRYDGTQHGIHSSYPRIPTAPMDLGAIVYLILRDHLPKRVRNGWPKKLRKAAYALPHLPSNHFQVHLRPQRKIDSLWWYYMGDPPSYSPSTVE